MKKTIKIFFIFYIIILSYLLFFRGVNYNETTYITYNLIPFATIKRYIYMLQTGNALHFIINVVGNVIVFIPFGLFIPRLFVKSNKLLYMFIISLIIPIIIESIQFLLGVGILDIDDLILNSIGIMIGYIIFREV